jgi:uncharacterized protein (TIGR02271 family)
MSQVVGFYKSQNEAKRICDELTAAGFDRDEVRVFGGEHVASAASAHDSSFWQSVKDFFGGADETDHQLYAEAARRGSVGVAVDADTDAEEQKAADILRRGSAMDLDRESTEWRKTGWTGGTKAAATGSTTTGTAASRTASTAATQNLQQGKQVVPVVEEQLQVGKRQVQSGGVRIHSRVTTKPVQAQVNLREEHVDVQRRAVDRPLTDADKAFRDRNIEVTETREQPVIAKEARVVEEVVVGKNVQQRTQTVRDQVRRTDVDVERTPGSAASTTTGFSDPDTFARELATDTRYRGRDWSTVSSDAQRTFEQRYPGSKWDQFKDSIQRGYEKLRQKV